MTELEAAAILVAGVAAGTINAVVGSGTLITFPVLLAVGYPPVVANVSNTVGLVPGSLAGAIGYRRELAGQGGRAVRLGCASLAGGITGAVLLLVLPESAFEAIVPVFIGIALVLIVLQPRLSRRLGRERPAEHHGGAAVALGVYGGGVYGGYFGAAQGILLLGILGLGLPDDLQRINALKNVLAGIVNLVAGVVFVVVADVAWGAALLVAAGAVVGGWLGARYGRRLPPAALRAVIVVVGLAAIAELVS
ncbi:MAG: sulfite exporter TauE/SafE family protein [Solirubrobacteraceae bacterium]